MHAGTLRGAGSGIVGRQLVRELIRQAPARQGPWGTGHELLIYLPRAWAAEPRPLAEDAGGAVQIIEVAPGLAEKLRVENLVLRQALERGEADVLLSLTDTSLPACPVPQLLLIHLAHLAWAPEDRDLPRASPLALKVRLIERYLRLGLPSVTRTTVQTEDMATRIASRYGYPRERIDVIPHGVTLEPLVEHPQPVGGPPYLTYVATPGPHKRHHLLAGALAALGPEHSDLQCRLTLEPEDAPELVAAAREHGLLERFVFEGRVPHARALALLRDARALVYPSHLESFALPLYEAHALGTPIVAADRPYAREACGAAAIYVPSDDGMAFGHALLRAEVPDPSTPSPWSDVGSAYLDVLEGLRDEA